MQNANVPDSGLQAAWNIDPTKVTPGMKCYGSDDQLVGTVDRVEGSKFWLKTDYGVQPFPLDIITAADTQGLHLNYNADDLTAQTR